MATIDENSNTSYPATSSRQGDNTWTIESQRSPDESDINLATTLPGYDKDENRINWMGGSYTGADIKVVAHLYAQEDRAHEIAFWNSMSASYEGLISGLTSFILNAPTARSWPFDSDFDREQFLRYGNLSRGDPGAAEFLKYYISFKSAPAATVTKMQNDLTTVKSMAKTIEDKLTKLQQLINKATSTLVLATLQTISVQSHREKVPVRAIGHANVKGFTRAQRTIAGSMIFTMFNEHALAQLIREMGSVKNKYGDTSLGDGDISMLLADQLPPLDVTILFANEYGSLSQAAIYGVEFMNDGMTLSIEDLLTEEVINFVARDVDPVMSKGHISLMKNQRGMHFAPDGALDETGTSLLYTSKDAYNAYLEKLKIRRKLRSR